MLGFLIKFDTIYRRSKEHGLLQLVWLDSGVQSHVLVDPGPLGEHRNLGMSRLRHLHAHARLERDRLPHRVKAMLDATE